MYCHECRRATGSVAGRSSYPLVNHEAARQGFEPWRLLHLAAFKAAALDHYAISPVRIHLTVRRSLLIRGLGPKCGDIQEGAGFGGIIRTILPRVDRRLLALLDVTLRRVVRIDKLIHLDSR